MKRSNKEFEEKLEKDFAEYYLLGTLLSTIIVVLSSFII